MKDLIYIRRSGAERETERQRETETEREREREREALCFGTFVSSSALRSPLSLAQSLPRQLTNPEGKLRVERTAAIHRDCASNGHHGDAKHRTDEMRRGREPHRSRG